MSRMHFLEVAVQVWLNEDDTIEKFLHDNILVPIIHRCDGLELDVGLPVYGGLRNGYQSSVLIKRLE